jgi:hypothetical protein
MDVRYPFQVEQSDRMGRPKVDAFETATERAERRKGLLVSFDYTDDALTEIDRYFQKTGKVIVPLPFVKSSTNRSRRSSPDCGHNPCGLCG